jgi:hypothetical protein
MSDPVKREAAYKKVVDSKYIPGGEYIEKVSRNRSATRTSRSTAAPRDAWETLGMLFGWSCVYLF